jgi:flagellin FlaB
VFAYVVLGAGFFTTQKAQETIYKGVEQSTSNLQIVGNVYGMKNTSSTTDIKDIQFTISLAPGASATDLSGMTMIFTTPSTNPKEVIFEASPNVLNTGTQSKITILNDVTIPPGSKFTLELRPVSGASFSITRTAPAIIDQTNLLY